MVRQRVLGLVISILFFCTTFFFFPFSIRADSTKLVKIISKDPSVVELCFANGIPIFETYETFYLAQIKEQDEDILKNLSLQYEIILDANKIKFGNYELISNEEKSFIYPEGLSINQSYPNKQLYFVQFVGPIKQDWKDILTQNDIGIGFSIDRFGLIVQTNNTSIEFLKSLRFVKAVGILPDQCKISSLTDMSQEKIDLEIITMLHFNLKELQDSLHDPLAEYFYDETSVNGTLVIMNLPTSLFPKVIENQDIIMVNPKGKPLIYNAEAAQVMNINDSSDQNQISGLKGEGEIVGVADTGLSSGDIPTLHPAFAGKIVATYPSSGTYPADGWYDLNGHGTHVCGSILGSGAGDVSPYSPRYKGMAPDARLVFQCINSTYGNNSIYTILNDAYNSGARIHSNSWSNQNNSWGQYDIDASSIDQLMWEHMDMQVLFAAGNSRSSSQYGIWPPANNGTHTLTNFCGAKNGITVGASQNNKPSYFFNRMSSFSSLGPTHDGRIKPDVIAPGNTIRSTYAQGYYNPSPPPVALWTSTYTSMSGTSMATPITAGALSLIRENFRKTYQIPPADIPASLLKATVINGCNTSNVFDYQGYSGGPELFLSRNNYISGYGRVDIKNSTFPSDKSWMFYNEYSSNGTRGLKQGELIKRYYVYVPQTSQPLKATLAWTDMPGTACTYTYDPTVDPVTHRVKGNIPNDYYDPTPELVNDLDITISKYDSTSEQFVGNLFDPNGFSTNMASSSILNPYDVVNNVEVVNIQNPTVGVYEIEISAFRSGIQSDSAHSFRQPFSLVVSGSTISTAFPPSTPFSITGKTTCTSNELSWNEAFNGKDPVSFFRIKRITITGPNAGATETYQVPESVHTYSDTNITVGTEYFYYLQAITTKGMISDNSMGITLGLIVPPGTSSFYPPTIRPTNVVLYWSAAKHGTCPVKGYYLYRSPISGQLGTLISPLIPMTQPASIVTPVEPGETWYYSIVAVDTHYFAGKPSKQIKVLIPFDQTETVLTVEASKKELCQGDALTIKIVIYNKSVVDTDSLKFTFAPSSDISFKGSDRLTGVTMPSGGVEFLIGKLSAKSTYTFSLFCQQNGTVQWERSTHLLFVLADTKEVLNQEELTLLLKKCGGGDNQGSIGISAKVLNLVTDPSTGERYLPFGEELKLFLEFSGGSGPYTIKINWGDGQNESKKVTKLEPMNLTHKYESKGTMTIQIELTDSAGNVKKISFSVNVK
jgi:hypothetical protein